MPRILLILCLLVSACAPQSNRLLVSDSAVAVGGNLFIEDLGGGEQILVLDGEITPMTSFAFQSLLEHADIEGLVIAQSPGGNLLAAHQIGRAIAENGLNTAVIVSCRSACVDVFIAGRQRDIVDGAELGLHAASDREFGYFVDKPYWDDFNLGAINEAAYSVPNRGIWIITPDRAVQLRLATRVIR